MTRIYLAVLVIILGIATIPADVNAQESNELFTIYLVRHAEKDLSAGKPGDPPLAPCGEARSEALSLFLKAVQLDAVYSTDYART